MKKIHKYLLTGLSAALLATAASSAVFAADLSNPIPLTNENKGVVDNTKGNGLAKNGYFTQDIQVGDETRTAKIYIGTDAPIRCYWTVVNVPEGMETETFLEKTGWADLMDERGEGLFVLEPGAEGWGSYEEEQAYLTEAFKAYNTKTWYSNFSTSYLVGYGEGGQDLHQYAMANSLAMIGGVFVDANNIDPAYIDATGATVCSDGVTTLSEVPMPVWMINSKSTKATKAVENYWKKANDVVKNGKIQSDMSVLYNQKKNSKSIVTSYSDTRSKVRVLNKKVNALTPAFTRKAYNFMSGYTRYETANIFGNALGARPDYKKMGVDFYDIVVDDLVREYMVYVPKCVKKSGKKAPMVMIMGGTGQPNRVFFDATHWWEIADKEGIILVSPCAYSEELRWNNTGTPNNRDDIKFINIVLDSVFAKYPVDTTRVYATGQSNGAVMSEFLAQVLPERFAANAATSGGLIEANLYQKDNGNAMIPMYVLFGEADLWDYDYKVEGNVRLLVDYFNKRNMASSVDAPDTCKVDGRFTTYGWKNAEGFTMTQLTQTQGRPHNCIPTEMNLEWDFFKNWKRAKNGTLYYKGKAVKATKPGPTNLMKVQIPATDPAMGIYQPITGLYTDNTLGINRTAKVYIPEGAKYGSYAVMVNTPCGMDAVTFLKTSGWQKVADKNKIVVYVLEPKSNGVYGTEEEEMAYIQAAYKSMTSSTYYKLAASYYFVGYGAEGTVMQKYAMTNPLAIAAAAYIDASNIDADYLASMAEYPADSRNTGVAADVPTPVWFFGKTPAAVVDYYMAANRCDGSVKVKGALKSTVYTQTEDTLYYEQGNIGKVAVSKSAPLMTYASAAAIYDFLDEYFTYGSVATGWMTGERAVYGKKAGQVQTVEFTQTFDGVDYAREYVIYDGSHGKKNVPLVIAAPGSGTSDTVMMDTSMWWKIAEENEFVAVCMTGVPGNAGAKIGNIGEDTHGVFDLEYVDMVVDQVTGKYSIDTNRMYFSGQSQGSVFTHWVALNRADVFAAVASTSGAPQVSMLDYPDPETYDGYLEIPYYLIAGDYDVCPVVMPATGDTRRALSMMIGINDCVVDVDNWSSEVVDGRYTDYTWNNAEGKDVVAFSRCGGRGHSVVVSDNYRLFNWMMKWSK